MVRLLSVNVGIPGDIVWKGRTVHTGIWKNPVTDRCRVGYGVRIHIENGRLIMKRDFNAIVGGNGQSGAVEPLRALP